MDLGPVPRRVQEETPCVRVYESRDEHMQLILSESFA